MLLRASRKVLIGALGVADTRIWLGKMATLSPMGLATTKVSSSPIVPENRMMAEDKEKLSRSESEQVKGS